MKKPTKISWQAPEHNHWGDKTADWFWGLWIVSIGAIILSFYFGNILFGIIIILFAITSALHANKQPAIFDFEINRQGVKIGHVLFPYHNLDTFWVQDTEDDDVIIFRTKKSVQPFLLLPFDSTEIDAEELRDYLLDYMDEEKMEEPLLQKFMEFLGF
jgi:hypothetical protein